MISTSRLIVYVGVILLFAFGARAYQTDKDIPGNVQLILMTIITAGLASDGLEKGLGKLKKPDEDVGKQDKQVEPDKKDADKPADEGGN